MRRKAIELAVRYKMYNVAESARHTCYADIYRAWRGYPETQRSSFFQELYQELPNASPLFDYMQLIDSTPLAVRTELDDVVIASGISSGHRAGVRAAALGDGTLLLNVAQDVAEIWAGIQRRNLAPQSLHVWHLMSNVGTPALGDMAATVAEPGSGEHAMAVERLRDVIRLGVFATMVGAGEGRERAIALTKLLTMGLMPITGPGGVRLIDGRN